METSHQQPLKRAVIKEELVALTGDYVKAILLNQFIYWSERVDDFDRFIKEEKARAKETGYKVEIEPTQGWIYKKAEELSNETMLNMTKTGIGNHIKALVDSGWLEQRRNPRNKMDKTYQYRVNLAKIQKDLSSLGYSLEGYKVPIDYIVETVDELRSPQNGLRSELSGLRSEKNGLPSEKFRLPSPQIGQQYQRLHTEITSEITSNTHTELLNSAAEISATSETPVVQTDVCDKIEKLLGIGVNKKTLQTWHSYADDETIIQVAALAAQDSAVKNPVGYISSVLRNGFTPAQTALRREFSDDRYAAFYKLFPDS